MRAVRTHAVVQPVVSSTSRPKWLRMPTKSVWYYKNPKNPSSYAVPRSARPQLRARPVPTCPAPAHSLSGMRAVPSSRHGRAGRLSAYRLVRLCPTRYLLSFVFVFDNEQDTCAAATAALPYPHPFYECSPMARRR